MQPSETDISTNQHFYLHSQQQHIREQIIALYKSEKKANDIISDVLEYPHLYVLGNGLLAELATVFLASKQPDLAVLKRFGQLTSQQMIGHIDSLNINQGYFANTKRKISESTAYHMKCKFYEKLKLESILDYKCNKKCKQTTPIFT